MVNGAIGWRVAVGVTALLLIALGIGRTVDGWRHAPLFAYVHAEWWGHSQADLLLDFEAWKPSTSDGRVWSAYGQFALAWAMLRPDEPRAKSAQIAAEEAAIRGLSLAPAQPSA
jgi:hypothetical protein